MPFFQDNANTEERLEAVDASIRNSCRKASREHGEVELVAVSKGHPPEKVREVVEAGQALIGESKVQEARAKLPLLPPSTRCHFIGHLQKNKVRQALPLFEMLHSVDSLALAEAVDRVAAEEGVFPRVLLQVNVAGEAGKHGFDPLDLKRDMDSLLNLERLQIEGLMTIPPFSEDPEDSRPHFARLRELRDELSEALHIGLPHLSMGMSGDFPVAVEEGATLIRVGTLLFGPRSYSRKPKDSAES